ncbi:MAG: hypothetical protein V1729_02400 [Candidatus Woesearchaeota archaeon]
MSLDDILARILKEGISSILIVDDLCDLDAPHDDVYNEHIENESTLESFIIQKGLAKQECYPRIFDVSHEKVQNPSGNDSWYFNLKESKSPVDLILVSSNFNLIEAAPTLARSSATVKKLKSEFPGVEIVYFAPHYDSDVVNRVLNQVLPIFVAQEAQDVMERIDFEKFPTLMHYLCHKVTGRSYVRRANSSLSSQQHQYKNKLWQDQYVKYIDESLRAGNSQTSTDYRFLILSDREIAFLGDYQPSADEKVNVLGLDCAFRLQHL